MEKRPNIFKPNINKKLSNNKVSYYSFIEEKVPDVNKNNNYNDFRVNKITSNNYIFNTDVAIKTKNDLIKTKISGKMGSNIITSDGRIINTYKYLFVVKPNDTGIKRSFTYTDILIGNLEIHFED